MSDNVDHERDIWEARRVLERVADLDCLSSSRGNCAENGEPPDQWCTTCMVIKDAKKWMDGTEWVDTISWEPRDE